MTKNKINYTVDEILVLAFVLSVMISASFFIPLEPTGENVGSDVSVREKTDLEITVLDFFPSITIYDLQNITVEVMNTGSTGYNATITTYIYNLSNGTTLTLLSTYTDSTVLMHPGNTRGQKYVFAPATEGSYFIRVSVTYGSRVKEAWGSFFVGTQPPGPPGPPGNQTNQTNQTQPPPAGGGGGTSGGGAGGGGGGAAGGGGIGNGTAGAGGGAGTANGTVNITAPPQPPPEAGKVLSTPSISLNYPERVIVYRNISTLTAIKVINNGGTSINDLRLQLSTPLTINTDVNPKGGQSVLIGQSLTFLIAMLTSTAEIGEHTLEFEVLSSQIKKEGAIIIEVRDSPESLKDLIYSRILNYEFLIGEIAAEIESVGVRGHDVTIPRKFILAAKEGLDRAKIYYDDKEYVKAFADLLDVEQNIKDAVFTLGNVVVKLYAVQQPAYYILIFSVPVVIFFVIVYRRRKERRPRLLREAKEE